jgi:hypothetical protein
MSREKSIGDDCVWESIVADTFNETFQSLLYKINLDAIRNDASLKSFVK